jgi:hypothetical protein
VGGKKEMKRRIALSIALVVSVVLVSLASSDSTAQAQQGIRRVADTGIVSLGPNQELRLTVMGDFNADGQVDAADYVLFRRMEYGQETCNSDGVCKLVVTSQTTTNPIRLRPGEAVSFTCIPGSVFGVRVVVESNRRARVLGIVFDTSTQRVVAIIHPFSDF